MYELFVTSDLPPVLSRDELNNYFIKYKNGDLESRNIIIEHNIRLVINIVNRFFYNTSYDIKDLISVGLIGLIRSVDKFDITKNLQFSTCAYKYITNEILKYMKVNKKHTSNDSINKKIKDYNDELELSDILIDEDICIEEEVTDKIRDEEIRKIIMDLPSPKKEMVSLYFGFGEENRLNQRQIAEKYNVSNSYVSMIIGSSLQEITKKMVKIDIIDIPRKVRRKEKK